MRPLVHGCIARCVLLLVFSIPGVSVQAKEVQQQMPNKLMGIAEYYPNNPDKPAVLVLHGFLQSNKLSTVQFIIDELVNNDYPVLAPTLSLNVNKRQQSLSCDTAHTHNLEGDNLEIKHWIQWLKKQGYQSIVLAGHSSGNMQLIHYLQNNTEPVIKSLIAVSPVTVWNTFKLEQTKEDIERARKALKVSANKSYKYTIGFCDRSYTATPENFLSYVNWSETDLLSRIASLPINTRVIIGDNDTYAPNDWIEKLRQKNIKVTVIEGADHFFSGDAEFLLQDSIAESMSTQLQ